MKIETTKAGVMLADPRCKLRALVCDVAGLPGLAVLNPDGEPQAGITFDEGSNGMIIALINGDGTAAARFELVAGRFGPVL